MATFDKFSLSLPLFLSLEIFLLHSKASGTMEYPSPYPTQPCPPPPRPPLLPYPALLSPFPPLPSSSLHQSTHHNHTSALPRPSAKPPQPSLSHSRRRRRAHNTTRTKTEPRRWNTAISIPPAPIQRPATNKNTTNNTSDRIGNSRGFVPSFQEPVRGRNLWTPNTRIGAADYTNGGLYSL